MDLSLSEFPSFSTLALISYLRVRLSHCCKGIWTGNCGHS